MTAAIIAPKSLVFRPPVKLEIEAAEKGDKFYHIFPPIT